MEDSKLLLEDSVSEYLLSESSSESDAEVVIINVDPPSETRKRLSNIYAQEARKILRNSGQAYQTSCGKQIAAKFFTNQDCFCRKKCTSQIDEESRKKVFDNFWKMGSFQAQNAYLSGLITQESPKRRRLRDCSRGTKLSTNIYSIPISNGSVSVCKKYFLHTFQISDGRLTRVLTKIRNNEAPGSDKRGRRVPVNKTPDSSLKIVYDHISSFPTYSSHYTGSQNHSRKFLDPNLNIRLMYSLYKEFCYSKTIQPVSEAIYRRCCNTI